MSTVSSGRDRLVLFTRFPVPGRTKTRLIPHLGPEGAAAVQRILTGHTVLVARLCAAVRDLTLEVRHDGATTRTMRRWLGRGLDLRPQGRGGLGERMERSVRSSVREGSRRTVLIGSDCPGITPDLLGEAFDLLETHDLVIGPARDGGYYLLGLRGHRPQLFGGIPWGTGEVLSATLGSAGVAGLQVALLPDLEDVDRPEDLPVWEEVAPPPHPSYPVPGTSLPARAGRPHPAVSVIIPTLDESDRIEDAIRTARTTEDCEVIVADGGSRDGTPALAEAAGARVISCPGARGAQLDAGALAARGAVLLFLHADTRLPGDFASHVQSVLDRPDTVAGAFRLRIDGKGGALRLVERMVGIRNLLFETPYGDQAIFLPARIFRELGGFAVQPILEDLELVERLRRIGRVGLAGGAVTTSDRRWRSLGVARTTAINALMLAGHRLGLAPERLARWYGRSGRGSGEDG